VVVDRSTRKASQGRRGEGADRQRREIHDKQQDLLDVIGRYADLIRHTRRDSACTRGRHDLAALPVIAPGNSRHGLPCLRPISDRSARAVHGVRSWVRSIGNYR
jgi:hypothetical protein